MSGMSALLRGWAIAGFVLLTAVSVMAAPRTVAVGQPAGGEVYQPGEPVVVSWTPAGNWQAGDTLRIEYSFDAGGSWQVVPGAEGLAYSLGSYTWDTTGCADSAQYVLKVACNGRDTVFATSGTFELRTHTGAPVISHTPLSNTPHFAGPFRVSADVSDDRGVSSVKLHYRVNGGPMSELAMVQDGGAGAYCADIPGPIAPDALVQYYIEAVDGSYNRNMSRFPADPSMVIGFNINAMYTDAIGNHDYSEDATGGGRGNVFLCTQSAVLTRMTQGVSSTLEPFDLTFFVYESSSRDGSYRRIAESTHPAVTLGQVQNSGNLNALLVKGRYYIVGATSRLQAAFYHAASPGNASTIFGEWVGGYSATSYPPAATTTAVGADCVYAQDIATVRVSRVLAMTQETDGKWFEPGQTVLITLSAVGYDWQPEDTIRLEYSADSGVTWMPIVGAESLPYDTASYVWDTISYPESEHCRLRVVCNADASVYDASDADFRLRLDRTAPVIVHKPLVDGCISGGSRYVSATVTDDMGLKSVTCYFRKNLGRFVPYNMTVGATPGGYSCYLPTSGVLGDRFDYYIDAVDVSRSGNSTRNPEAGYHSFALIDALTEAFVYYSCHSMWFDLAYTSLTYTPDGSASFYSLSTKPIATLPTDPTGGTSLTIQPALSTMVVLPAGKQVSLYGGASDRFYVAANGSITFDVGDDVKSGSIEDHYRLKRISGLFTYLLTPSPGDVSWKALSDRVAVTYQNMPLPIGRTTVPATFQIEMFYDGRIRLSYLGVIPAEPIPAVVGLSNGFVPAGFANSDLSGYPAEPGGDVEVADSVGVSGDREADLGLLTPSSLRTARVTLRNNGPGDIICDNIRLGYYYEDFNDNAAQGWREIPDSQWSEVSGEYMSQRQFAWGPVPAALYSWEKYTDLYCEALMRLDSTYSTGELVLRANGGVVPPNQGLVSGYSFTVYEPNVCTLAAVTSTSSSTIWQGESSAMLGQWSALAVDAKGTTLRMYVNGVLAGTTTKSLFSSGYVGLRSGQTSLFDSVFVGPSLDSPERSTGFRLTGVPTLPIAIGPGESRDIDVTYDPITQGTAAAAVLQFVMRGADERRVVVRLSGTDVSAAGVTAVKRYSDGNPVALLSKRVTAVFADRFYMEEPGRNSGICVLWDSAMPAVGDVVTVYGKLVTVAGERAVRAGSVKW